MIQVMHSFAVPRSMIRENQLETMPAVVFVCNDDDDDDISSAGLGVVIAPGWVLTCEHVIAGGPRQSCDLASMPEYKPVSIAGAYLENSADLIAPGDFSRIMGTRTVISPDQERLVLLKVSSDLSASVSIRQISRGAEAILWAAKGNPDSRSEVIGISFKELDSAGESEQLFQTEPFSSSDDYVSGQSGSGYFQSGKDGVWALVAIQNAQYPESDGNLRALAIPVSRAESWIRELIK